MTLTRSSIGCLWKAWNSNGWSTYLHSMILLEFSIFLSIIPMPTPFKFSPLATLLMSAKVLSFLQIQTLRFQIQQVSSLPFHGSSMMPKLPYFSLTPWSSRNRAYSNLSATNGTSMLVAPSNLKPAETTRVPPSIFQISPPPPKNCSTLNNLSEEWKSWVLAWGDRTFETIVDSDGEGEHRVDNT